MTFNKLKNNKSQTMRIKWMNILIKMSQKVSSNNMKMSQKVSSNNMKMKQREKKLK